mgnify:CR=1 FL=1
MRKINGVPFTAHIDLSSLTGGEVIKWDSTNTLMAWEDQDSTGFVPLPAWVGGRGVFRRANRGTHHLLVAAV